ncbi:MAG: hydrogenobyrinic acid a,c-diamide synthase (glutamine-hydrolyzing) [Archaeoglobus sp.]|nr:hydrogenobyrinic acid a,c-diamide synthase (glutamine-hydrolyzing) [Archaeoglobus sp.]
MDIPRIVIAGVKSKVGKTMLSIGLMRALRNRGLAVQPFKAGPDFIDPSFHYFATGRKSRNLDTFMMDAFSILETFQRNSRNADIAIIEGKTGLFDSHDAVEEEGSTAHLAKILKAPVLLVADVERMSRSIAALIHGYKTFDGELDLRGVILNRTGNPRHSERVRIAVQELTGLKVYGTIPRRDIWMPYRHLGLIPAHEREEYDGLFDSLAELVEKYVDVDAIIELSRTAPPLEEVEPNPLFMPRRKFGSLGVVMDKPFSFYYQDNLDAIEAAGLEIRVIDSLSDKKLPEVNALYIGGGFPEVFAEDLEKNRSLREKIYEFCEESKPVYAECGGLMFLGESIITESGEYEMVGFLPFKTEMNRKFHALGYTVYESMKDTIISKKGDVLRGHEFHYSRVIPSAKLDFAFKVLRGKGIGGRDGVVRKSTLACYQHLNVLSYPEFIQNFVSSIRNTKNTV